MAADVRSLFDLPEFRPYQTRYLARRQTFVTRHHYYKGTIYQDSAFRIAHKLYAATKALFLPLARAVDLDVALIPGMGDPWALDEAATDAQRAAQGLLYTWSQWATVGDTWLEDGAKLGEALLKVVAVAPGAVALQRLDPTIGMLTRAVDETGQTVDMLIIADPEAEDAGGERYEYGEVITPSLVRTYRNGEPFGYDGQPERWENPLGFVPVVQVLNDARGEPTFAKCQPQLDAVNELASYLADIIGRHAEPQWAITGAEQGELTKSGQNVWFLPAGAKIEAILAQIDVAGTLAFIQAVGSEMKGGLPELAFDDLRAKDQIATETLRVQLIELEAKIWKMRRRYDAALVQAHQMAALTASIYGIAGLEPLLEPHSLDGRRPILPPSRMEEIALEQAELALEAQRAMASGDGLTATAVRDTDAVQG